MRIPFLTAALAALTFALPAVAQKVQVFGGNSQGHCSSLVLFGDDVMAALTVTHGQPQWQAEYDGMLGKVKGKTLRLGKDLWTTFMNNVEFKIGDAKIPAGNWVVGLQCDQEGNFSLAFLDATKAMQENIMPFGPQTWTPDHVARLELKKDAVEEAVEKMTIELKGNQEEPMLAKFVLSWGKHQLVADITINARR